MAKAQKDIPADPAPANPAETAQHAMLDVDVIVRSPYQVRAEDDDGLDALAADMAANGLIQPVTVRRFRSDFQVRWELIAGHRRLAAAKRLGWEQIPAIVVEADDAQAEAMLVAENFARRDLTPLETADTAAGLVKRHGAAAAAKICGKSERWAWRMAYIAGRLSEDWRRIARRCRLSQASLEELCKGTATSQRNLLDAMLDEADCHEVDGLLALDDDRLPEALRGGGDPDELGAPAWDGPVVENLPWVQCGCGDCDGCQDRTDAIPEIAFDDERRDDRPTCIDPKCRTAKMKEWLGGRGLREWSRKLGVEVTPQPKGIESWKGSDQASKMHCVPYLITHGYPEGGVKWFEKPSPKKRPEKQYPTNVEARDAAFCETVRKWVADCDDITALTAIVIALSLVCSIDGRVVYGRVQRLQAVAALENTGMRDALRADCVASVDGLLALETGRTGHTGDEMAAAHALADILCGGDPKAREGLRAEAAALGEQRIRDIAEAKAADKAKARKGKAARA